MDENDQIEFPAWMTQYSQAIKTIEARKNREIAKQVQGSSTFGNLPEFRSAGPSCGETSEKKYFRKASPQKSQEDGVSCLQHVGDIAYECELLLNIAASLQEPLLLGLDLDWPSTYAAFMVKTNTIHLCYGEKHCLLFEVLHVKKLPLVFIKLIKHPNVRLIGHNIVEDLLKLGKDFNVDVKQVITSNLILTSSIGHKLSCKHRWSYQKVNHEENEQIFENFTCEPEVDTTARFLGKIEYCTSFQDCAAFSEALLIRADNCDKLALGFDLEWPFRYGQGSGKVALIQICPDETICYIFHVFQLKALPKALVLLLGHPNVRLTGLNIANDIRKLGRDFNIDLNHVLENNLVELCVLANEKLHCNHRWSLAGLVANQLKIDLDKGPVRVSNWAKVDLSEQQIAYAATDAYVSLLCYLKLNSINDT